MKTTHQNQNFGLKSRPEQLSTATNGIGCASALTPQNDNRLSIDRNERRMNRTLPTTRVLDLLISRLPDVYGLSEVVGKWVWVQFRDIPAREIRQQLAQLGFHWNRMRQAWQHPCGVIRNEAASFDPRNKYGSYFPADVKPV